MNIIRNAYESDINTNAVEGISKAALNVNHPYKEIMIIGLIFVVITTFIIMGAKYNKRDSIGDITWRAFTSMLFSFSFVVVIGLGYDIYQYSTYNLDGYYLAHIENFEEVPNDFEIIDHSSGHNYWVREVK